MPDTLAGLILPPIVGIMIGALGILAIKIADQLVKLR